MPDVRRRRRSLTPRGWAESGSQDAINLAWKLALVIKGQGTEALLDSHNTERHANAKRLLGFDLVAHQRNWRNHIRRQQEAVA